MRSARSASRVCGVCGGLLWAGRWPLWPSFMAVVERAESEVVVLVGVPLCAVSLGVPRSWVDGRGETSGPGMRGGGRGTHGMSGVSGVGD